MSPNDQQELEARIGGFLETANWTAAAAVAIEGYGPEILGYLGAVLGSEANARDVYSMFSEDLWRGLPSFRRASSFRTWAYKLAWHAAARFFKDPYPRRVRPLVDANLSQLADAVRTRTAPHLKTTVKSKMARLRASLSPDEQTLLILRIDRGLSWQQIREVLSNESGDEAALRKRFERLKDKLRKLARAEGLLPSG